MPDDILCKMCGTPMPTTTKSKPGVEATAHLGKPQPEMASKADVCNACTEMGKRMSYA